MYKLLRYFGTQKWLIYLPNPATNIINIKSNEIISNVKILDLVGRIVIKENVNFSIIKLNVQDLNNEIYYQVFY